MLVVQAIEIQNSPSALAGPNINDNNLLIRDLKRGISDTHYEQNLPIDEVGVPDHLVFVLHGIGEVSDFSFRNIQECTSDMRSMGMKMRTSHFGSDVNRTEFLPIEWCQALHGDENGIETALKNLSLPSIRRLRDFTNGTLTDILLYSSPVYAQRIIDKVGAEFKRIFELYQQRVPEFRGKVSFVGHSLGSLILFDILANQNQQNAPSPRESISKTKSEKPGIEELLKFLNIHTDNLVQKFKFEEVNDLDSLFLLNEADLTSLMIPLGVRRKILNFISSEEQKSQFLASLEQEMPDMNGLSILTLGSTEVKFKYQQFDSGIGQPAVRYPQLPVEKIHAFFALGSPVSMFLSVRGVQELGLDFELPNCDNMYNVFHPFDPCAYRIEPMVNMIQTNYGIQKPVLIPHHTGRKRFHLELRENISKYGAELKNSVIRNMKGVMQGIHSLIYSQDHKSEATTDNDTDAAVQAATQEILSTQNDISRNESADNLKVTYDETDINKYGLLNKGRRIDYVLQERPLEAFNDYLFAFQSHLCYWTSEDTVLMILRELYGLEGISPIKRSPKNSTTKQ